jgi:hypothetical protein
MFLLLDHGFMEDVRNFLILIIVDYHAVSDSFKDVLDHEEKILLMTL